MSDITAIYGCDGCRTTTGRAGCPTHRDRANDAVTDGYSANGGNLGVVHRHLVNCYRPECWLDVHDCAVYLAAGVTLAPQPDTASRELREAAQAVVDFDWSMWERGDKGTVVMRKSDVALMFALLDALRAALTHAPEEADHE